MKLPDASGVPVDMLPIGDATAFDALKKLVDAFDEVVSARSFRMYPECRWVNPMADATAEKPSGKLDLSWRRADRGGALYTLSLPKDVPAANFWSVTLYEAENASGLANGQPLPSLGSRDEPIRNPDGSTELHLSPEAPEGKERNWLATVPGKGFFAFLRLYGPTGPALAKTWKSGDITRTE
jgi:hypothetical protein